MIGRASVLTATLLSTLVMGCGGGSGQPPSSSSAASGASGPTAAAAAAPTADHRGVVANRSTLDVDGDGVVGAYTDSLLIFRYTSGFRGESLIAGAVSEDCTRCTAEQIESYIGSL